MEWLQTLANNFVELFKWMFILQPWEQALHIRLGKKVRLCKGGWYFRYPYIDSVWKQNTRIRFSDMPAQTVTTTDGHTITLAGAVKFRIFSIRPLYLKLHHAEQTITITVQGIVADYVTSHTIDQTSPRQIKEHVNRIVDLENWGLTDTEFELTDYAVVRTYRIIMGDLYKYTEDTLKLTEES